MKLSKYSEVRLRQSMNHWRVPGDFAVPMYNYLVFGLEPGSFFMGWYANDAMSIIRCHSATAVESLKDLSKWMLNCMPPDAKGSHEKVKAWTKMSSADRRKILEEWDLVFTEEQETWKILKDEPMDTLSYY
jgi:hypothetical protein